MAVYKETIMLKSHGGTPTYVNITPQVREAIEKSGIKNGICVAISPHTTCSVFFEEFVHDYNEAGDEFLQEDLNDVLKKIIPDHVNADHIFILPNNKNIILAANQARDLTEDKEIIVVPSKTVPQGITALTGQQ